MSDVAQGPGWWQASDGRWYPPELYPSAPAYPQPADDPSRPRSGAQPGWWPAPGAYAYPLPMVAKYCVTCGFGLVASAGTCPRCGSPVAGRKSRSVAVVLAIFLSFWSFLYTYKTAAWKFWVGLGLAVGSFVSDLAVRGATGRPDPALGAVWLIVSTGVWVWSIVDRSTTPL